MPKSAQPTCSLPNSLTKPCPHLLHPGLAATSNWVTNAVVAQTFLTLTRTLGGSGAWRIWCKGQQAELSFAANGHNGSAVAFCQHVVCACSRGSNG